MKVLAIGPTVPAQGDTAPWRTVLVQYPAAVPGPETDSDYPWVVHIEYNPGEVNSEYLYGIFCETLGEGLEHFHKCIGRDIKKIIG